MGLADCRCAQAASMAASDASRLACKATPYAAAAPISGAPRSHMSRMAVNTASGLASVSSCT